MAKEVTNAALYEIVKSIKKNTTEVKSKEMI